MGRALGDPGESLSPHRPLFPHMTFPGSDFSPGHTPCCLGVGGAVDHVREVGGEGAVPAGGEGLNCELCGSRQDPGAGSCRSQCWREDRGPQRRRVRDPARTEPWDPAAFPLWERRGVHKETEEAAQRRKGPDPASSPPVTPNTPSGSEFPVPFSPPAPSLTFRNTLKSLMFVNTEKSQMPRETRE